MPYSPTWGDKHFQKGFRDALQNLNKAKREEVTRKRQHFDHNYLAIGRVAEALLRMAGKGADAYRIHPSTREVDLNLTGVERTQSPSSRLW